MSFSLSPILDIMSGLYEKPRTVERFNDYLKLIQGNTKDDMVLPIGNYNPMGKEHVLEKINELKKLKAEEIISETLTKINILTDSPREFKVSIAVADDLKGAWTNKFTTDYDSKFKLNALVARNFCTPLFWTSESFSEDLIIQRTTEACYRTLYWLDHPKPATLEDHILQEAFVARRSKIQPGFIPSRETENFYREHKNTNEYSVIFNFLYGDAACLQLNFPVFGIKENYAGFQFAASLRP